MANVALTKSTHWKEEQEHRMIFRLQDLKKERIQRECREPCNRPPRKNDEFTFFKSIRADAVQEVFMGCCISEGDALEIKNAFAKNFSKARLFRMKRHDTKFKLTPVPIN